MKQTLIPVLFIVALLLAACNQPSSGGPLPTLVLLPTETATPETQNQVAETEEPIATDEVIATEEALVTDEPFVTDEPEPDISEPTFSLSDFDNPTLWRIVATAPVNAYTCPATGCDVQLTYQKRRLNPCRRNPEWLAHSFDLTINPGLRTGRIHNFRTNH